MDARGHRRAAAAVLAGHAAAELARVSVGAQSVPGGTGDDRRRAVTAWRELVAELERRGAVVHVAPRPTRDAPALPLEHDGFRDAADGSTDGGDGRG